MQSLFITIFFALWQLQMPVVYCNAKICMNVIIKYILLKIYDK